jgi:uncharacterized protein YhhL (DUF1145 family)
VKIPVAALLLKLLLPFCRESLTQLQLALDLLLFKMHTHQTVLILQLQAQA